MRKKLLLLLAFFIGCTYLFLGVSDLKHYGPNWDESVHFGRGYAFLHFFLTGEKDYRKLEKTQPIRRSSYQHNYYSYAYFEDQISNAIKRKEVGFGGGGHPPFSDLIAAASNYILYSRLGVLGDIEAFHFYSVLVSAVLAASLFYFVAKQYSLFSGLITVLAFSLYPFFLGESRFNIKDIPEAVFYSLVLLTFYKGITENNFKWIFASSLFFGMGLGTKLNILFVLFIILPWLFIFYFSEWQKEGVFIFFKKRSLLFLSFFFYPIMGIGVFVGTWPILWTDLWNRFLTVVSYYKSIGFAAGFDSRFLSIFNVNTYAIQWIIYTTPLITLFLSFLGIEYALTRGFKEKNKTALFILIWFLVPILRVTVPNSAIYGGARQIAEYIPAMAVLAGIGGSYIVALLHGFIVQRYQQWGNRTVKQSFFFSKRLLLILQLAIIVSFIPITLKIISMYPFESIYFNELIGSLRGAKEYNIPGWGNSLGSTYRQATNWLNKHAEKNAILTTVYELRSNIPELLLREDIQYINSYRSTTKRRGEYLIGVTHEGVHEDTFHRKYLERYLDPVYELIVDRVAVLKIWKNDLDHTKPVYRKTEEQIANFSVIKLEKVLRVDLKRIVPITRVVIHYQPNDCTPPTIGYFEYSSDGKNWYREPGSFTAVPFSTWFMTQPEKGVLQYQFAAESARFVQAVTVDKHSCLLDKDTKIQIYRL